MSFRVTAKDANSTAELRVTPSGSWSACSKGAANGRGALTFHGDLMEWEPYPMVIYSGGPLHSNATKPFSQFPLCAIGPKSLTAKDLSVGAGRQNQSVPQDNSYLWFSSNSLYNASIPDGGDPANLPQIRECHARGDKTHLDSAVFASNDELLSHLPNPYGSEFRNSTYLSKPEWANVTVTIQMASVTAGAPQAKRTVGANASTAGPGRTQPSAVPLAPFA